MVDEASARVYSLRVGSIIQPGCERQSILHSLFLILIIPYFRILLGKWCTRQALVYSSESWKHNPAGLWATKHSSFLIPHSQGPSGFLLNYPWPKVPLWGIHWMDWGDAHTENMLIPTHWKYSTNTNTNWTTNTITHKVHTLDGLGVTHTQKICWYQPNRNTQEIQIQIHTRNTHWMDQGDTHTENILLPTK